MMERRMMEDKSRMMEAGAEVHLILVGILGSGVKLRQAWSVGVLSLSRPASPRQHWTEPAEMLGGAKIILAVAISPQPKMDWAQDKKPIKMDTT